ncbi:hypothetical protein DSO57_1000899 [Entomophthora muscae]|uniref:Uncharacterized protein n=1 Tax=Entomophthora muscae TaxID=34485 RepID=A0ACC2SYF7_9FUNG|nr:hypothetical protein DSO57_1000899 [Entomophthora muscae]
MISLKAASFINVKSALLNAVQPNKNLSLALALKSVIYGAHNVSNLICHLLTFKDDFEVPMPSGPRAFQENRKNHLSLKSLKLVKALPLKEQLCGKPGHMSRECKQTVPKVHHVGAEEYNSEGDKKDEEASQDEEPKNC